MLSDTQEVYVPGDLEAHDNSLPKLEFRDIGPDLLHDSHKLSAPEISQAASSQHNSQTYLMPKDIALLQRHNLPMI